LRQNLEITDGRRGEPMRDVRRKAVRPANASPAGRDSGRMRTQSAPEAALAAFRRFIPGHAEHLAALGFFAALGAIVLSVPARLIEPDDLAYRASLYALRQGHLVLSNAQYLALNYQLRFIVIQGRVIGITQWDHLPDGSWISQKNPGYPFFVFPFFAAGLLRLAPLCYAGAACVALFCGARRWLGRWGGAAAVGLFCSSGAAILFAWRPTMASMIDASLVGAGAGALLWAILAGDVPSRRRTAAGLLGFLALEAAVFVRYTDVVFLACAVLAVLAARRSRLVSVPARGHWWWLGSVLAFGIFLGWVNEALYGGPARTGYGPGEAAFGITAIGPNLTIMPVHLVAAMPVLFVALGGLASIAAGYLRRGPAGDTASRDLGIGLVLALAWAGLWGVYAAYEWTARFPQGSTLQLVRFYLPAVAVMALLGARLLVRFPRTAALACVVALFALGGWNFAAAHTFAIVPADSHSALPPGR
jgi:hypothetical protein